MTTVILFTIGCVLGLNFKLVIGTIGQADPFFFLWQLQLFSISHWIVAWCYLVLLGQLFSYFRINGKKSPLQVSLLLLLTQNKLVFKDPLTFLTKACNQPTGQSGQQYSSPQPVSSDLPPGPGKRIAVIHRTLPPACQQALPLLEIQSFCSSWCSETSLHSQCGTKTKSSNNTVATDLIMQHPYQIAKHYP